MAWAAGVPGRRLCKGVDFRRYQRQEKPAKGFIITEKKQGTGKRKVKRPVGHGREGKANTQSPPRKLRGRGGARVGEGIKPAQVNPTFLIYKKTDQGRGAKSKGGEDKFRRKTWRKVFLLWGKREKQEWPQNNKTA